MTTSGRNWKREKGSSCSSINAFSSDCQIDWSRWRRDSYGRAGRQAEQGESRQRGGEGSRALN